MGRSQAPAAGSWLGSQTVEASPPADKPDAVAYLHSMAEMISAADSAEELQKISDDVNANYKAAGIARGDLKPIAAWRDQIAASMAEAS